MKRLLLIIMAAMLLSGCALFQQKEEKKSESHLLEQEKLEDTANEKEEDKTAVDEKVITFTDENGYELLNGSHIKGATVQYGATSELGQESYYIQLELTDEGRKVFYKATSENVGKVIYINVNGEAISAPMVSEAINDNICVITGEFTKEQADDLARIINGK